MVSKIGFVCDSTADFPPGLAERLGLHTLPVHIVVDGRDFLHGISISNTEVLENLKQKRQVFTKPFLPAECADLYERLLRRYERIVSFHLSTSLSGNYNSACNALRLMGERDAARVKVIDMGSVSISLGLAVKKAVALLTKNPDIATLDKRLKPYQDWLFMGFTVEDLAWLKRGGRVSALSAFVGTMLDIKPIIQLENARLVPSERHRGKKPALKRLVELSAMQYQNLNGRWEIWLAYAGNLTEVMVTREKLAASINKLVDEIRLVEIGATISVHAGPGSVCVGMIPM